MSRAGQSGRRGLGRGLGALIPTQPPAPEPSEGSSAEEAGTPAARTPAEAAVQGSPSSDESAVRGDSRGPAGSGTPSVDRGEVEAAPQGVVPVAGASFAEIPVDRVRPNPRQPREVFDEDAMAELVHSISEIGLLQPIVVRPVDGEDDADYELVMGERRWRATREAGLDVIPAIVRSTDDTDMLRDALLENLHRSQLNPLEEAAAYGQLLEDFGCTHEELAQRIGRSRPQISNTLRLLRLTPAVQRRVAAGVLSAGHARALVGVEDSDAQDRLAQRVVAEGISVRGLEELVSVGSQDERPARTTRRRPTAPGLTELSERLADRLETRVKIDLGKSRGKIVVDFATLEDLQRIVDIMDPRNRSDRAI